jgi:membrane protease YdiL (CAAX protease family)
VTVQLAVLAVGFAIEVVAWRLVAQGRFSVWTLMTAVFALHALAVLWVRPPVASGRVDAPVAALVGVGSGLALYAATRVFVAYASAWEPFRAHVVERYERAREVPLVLALAIGILVAVPGEELFWRGLAQPRLQDSLPVLAGPALAWLGYVAANVASGSLPFIAGAIVGGAVWGALALWTEGILASLLCHMLWTGLMVARPPVAGRRPVEPVV